MVMPYKDPIKAQEYNTAYRQRPEVKAQRKIISRKWLVENRQVASGYTAKWRKHNRFASALIAGRAAAKRQNYLPCNATKEELQNSFTGFCDVCQMPEGRRKLHMDHCHATGKFRGWLCNSCNLALGAVRDSAATLTNLMTYLQMGRTSKHA